MYECNICGKQFTQRTNRNRHRRQFHTNITQNGEFISISSFKEGSLIRLPKSNPQNGGRKQKLSPHPYPLTVMTGMK